MTTANRLEMHGKWKDVFENEKWKTAPARGALIVNNFKEAAAGPNRPLAITKPQNLQKGMRTRTVDRSTELMNVLKVL